MPIYPKNHSFYDFLSTQKLLLIFSDVKHDMLVVLMNLTYIIIIKKNQVSNPQNNAKNCELTHSDLAKIYEFL
jgi:hypothetical protein